MGSFRWVLQKVTQRACSHWIKMGKGTKAEEQPVLRHREVKQHCKLGEPERRRQTGQIKAAGDLEGTSGARDDGDRLTESLAPLWVN